ncbi:Ig-like domain-containing protein [Dyadobacter fermentans]|uniref:Conserved repeat domain protein n=1 Tax=Dyadobacter fermentans (strain ATCC 700827 / DSM 18053 / CIP 107007 / KCTC 52180 / NS114) TaxID=471854 RepID=C6W6Y0_DYAFD|nr:Ig-like domain-containing protein [Dyadobacter fermentans]ACT92589.1 conserved repeat domain protein [Dyadobacter fermentans DSM 18053]
MRNLYFYLAGAALLASGVEMVGRLAETPAVPQEWIVQKADRSVRNQQERVPFARTRKKSGTKALLAPSITATNTYVITSNTGPSGASAGDELEYTVTINNGGPDPATGTVFTETIDANTTLVPGSVKASPIAQNDSYSTIGNVGINIPEGTGLFANDVSPAGTPISLNSTTTVATTGGGSATITAATGAFIYEPAAGYSGNDTFTYEIQNGSGMTSTATVTISVGSATNMIWFINSAAAAGGTGTLSKPFNSISAFNSINGDGAASHPQNGHVIFIYSGSYTGPLTLRNDQKILGQGSTQSILSFTGFSAPNGTNQLPAVTGSNAGRPTLTTSSGTDNAINLGTTNIIKGINIANTTGTKISGSSAGTFTASEVGLSGSGSALNLTNKTLNASFSEVSSSSATNGVSPIRISSGNGTLTIPAGSITSTSVPAIDIAGKGTGDRIALNVTLTSVSANGGSKGLALQNATGSFQINGTGTTGGSGGTIQNIADRGIDLRDVQNITIKNMNLASANTAEGPVVTGADNTNANAAIHGLNVAGLALDRIVVSGIVAQMGINLRGGSNFNLTNSTINQSGTASIVEEGNIYATNLGGTNSIVNSALKRPGGRAAYFTNYDVNMTRLTIDNSSFEDAEYAACLLFEGKGSSTMSLKVQNGSRFTKPGSAGIEVYSNNSAQMEADIQGATIDIGSGADEGKGIDMAASGTSRLKFNVAGNTSDYRSGPGFNFFAFSDGYLEGNVTNNVLTNNATGEGGSFHGIAFSTQGSTARGIVRINGNTINNSLSSIGISAQAGSTGGAQSSAVIDNNNVFLTGSNFAHGVYVNSIGGTNYNGTLCASVTNNDVTLNGGGAAAGGYRAGTPGTVLNVQQAASSGSTAWTAGNNTPSGSGTQNGLGTINYNAGGPTGCPTPSFSGLREAAIEEPVAGRISADSSVTEQQPVQQVAAQAPAPTEPKEEIAQAATTAPSPARTDATQSGETVTVNGTGSGFTLPAGKNTVIKFRVVIDANIPASDCEVSTQGTVSGSNFTSVLTDDPNTTGTDNPTVTPVVSVPVITFCPGDQTLSPDPGTCTSTQTFAATAGACPVATITYTVNGNPITFPYAFPAGNTTVLVTASNGIGTAPTCSFTVTVTPTPAPPITDEPDAATICAGSGASFTVATSQTGVTYQWQKKPFGGAFADISTGTNPTADDATLTLTNVPASDNLSEYRCIITNPCNNSTSDAAVLTVNEITGSSATGTTSIAQGGPMPHVTFTATGGTLPYTFTYKINDGANQTVSTTGALTSAKVGQPTETVGAFTYELVSVTDAQNCTLTPPSPQTATITITSNLSATISGSTTACQSETAPLVTFTAVNGIAPFTFTYQINGGAEQQVTTTGASTTATVSVPTTATGTFVYTLTNVTGAGSASTAISGQTASVTIDAKPTIALTGDEYQCDFGADPQTYTVFFTATAGAVITTDKGTVSGNTVTGIPSQETAIIVATVNNCSDTLIAFKDCSMPVTLIDFSGAKVENTVALKWNTAEETNSDYFEVQRSSNGKNWTAIGTQKSQGESYKLVDYAFVDQKPAQGDNFYRLKMVDADKTFAYSKIINVRYDGLALVSELYPNPVSTTLNLRSTDWGQVKSVELHSLTGMSVYKSGKTVSKTIDVKNLPVGMYILTITHKNGEIVNRKVVINR